MPILFALLLGLLWAIKAARGRAEISLVLAPSTALAVVWVITAVSKADWALFLFFGGAIASVAATFVIGHQLRGRRMREVIEESDVE